MVLTDTTRPGVRIGQKQNRNNRAINVWDKREYKGSRRLGRTRAPATSKSRCAAGCAKFAREGAPDELDLDGTIKGTAHKGYLDIHMRPERRNTVKVLMFFDVGGSMDWHIKTAEELFSAARTEFKHLEYFYFPQLPLRVLVEGQCPPLDRAHAHVEGAAYVSERLQCGVHRDASMSPYEISVPGGRWST